MNRPDSKRQSGLPLLWAFLLPAVIFTVSLAVAGILPFGKITLLVSDLDSQYIEFMAEYRRILLGQGSFGYSWNAGLGLNFIGLIAYYLASPFNFLLIIFSESQLPLAVSLLTILKIGCAGAAFAWFLRKRYQAAGWLVPVFSACYALSAYAVGYAFNIMWLDALIWLPLLCGEIELLLRFDRASMSRLILFFAVSFISQFYMAWMTGGFCALYLITRMAVTRAPFKKNIEIIIRFAVSVGIAAGLSAFLLLPTYFVLKNNMGLIGQDFPAFVGQFPFFSLLPKLFSGSFDGIKDALPHIYCGIPVLIGCVLYFINSAVPLREKIAAGVVGCVLLFSFWFAPLDFLWHAMDHPSWFPYRYAFVFCFWAAGIAYEGCARSDRKKAYIAGGISLGLLAVSLLSGNRISFGMAAVNALLIAVWIFLIGSRRDKIAILVCFCELLLSCCLIHTYFLDSYTRLDDYQIFHEHYQDLVAQVMPSDGDFYRMDKTEIRNYNDPLGIGFSGVSHFSSTASLRQAAYLKYLGFNCYATWCTYQGATAASDALLRIRYEFGAFGKTGSQPVGTEVWEHDAVFPLFFFANDAFARYDYYSDGANPLERQNALLRLLGEDDGDYFMEIPVKITGVENLKKTGEKTYQRIDMNAPAFLNAEISVNSEKSSYLFIPGASLNYNVFLEDSYKVINANQDYSPFPVCLDGYVQDGITRVRIETTTASFEGGILAYELDTEKLSDLAESINADAPIMERTGETRSSLRVTPASEDRLMVSSIPFDSGWRVSGDGKALTVKMVHGSPLGVIVPVGCENITVSYSPYGMKPGLLLSGCGLLLWAAVIFVERKRRKKNI